MVRRRLRVIIFVTLLGSGAALFYAASQTHLYQSTEVLQVSRPLIDDDLAQTTVDGSAARRLQLIQQRLTARDTILEIAEQFDIFADAPDMPPGERVSRMRDAVQISGVAAAREGYTDDGAVAALSITATFDSPERAQGVAREFARRTMQISAETRIRQARETLEFFVEEERKLREALDALSREEAAYRLENNLTLPDGQEARQVRIRSLNEEILTIERERIALEQSLEQLDPSQRAATLERARSEINAQIEVLDQQQELISGRLEALQAAAEISPRVERELAAFARRREELQGELDVVSDRRAQAEVGFKLEQQEQAEHLTVIEPAALPDYPVTPSRKRTALMGGVGSLFFGLAVAFLLDLRRPVIRTARQMQSSLGITPVVTIPSLEPGKPGVIGRRIAAARKRTMGGRAGG